MRIFARPAALALAASALLAGAAGLSPATARAAYETPGAGAAGGGATDAEDPGAAAPAAADTAAPATATPPHWLERTRDALGLRVGALLDARVVVTDEARSWLDGGLGKGRYGGDGDDRDVLGRLAQLSPWIDLRPRALDGVFVHVRANVDTEPDGDGSLDRRGRVDLIESFAGWRWQATPHLRLKTRGGVYFPQISQENVEPLWSTPYTISLSAANSWIAEELRTTGAEASLAWSRLDLEVELTGGIFALDDPAGSLLAWRGWSLGDRETGLFDRVPLPPIPSLADDGPFAEQADWVEPFHELDDRPGWYAGLRLRDASLGELHAFVWDNRGDEVTFDGDQYAWGTWFVNMGARFTAVEGLEVLGQYLVGDTRMGRTPDGDVAVDAAFQTAFALASVTHGDHRLSARLDWFEVRDRDVLRAADDNDEQGHAVTLAYFYELARRHHLGIEALRIESDRPVRARLGLDDDETELLLQLRYRFRFFAG